MALIPIPYAQYVIFGSNSMGWCNTYAWVWTYTLVNDDNSKKKLSTNNQCHNKNGSIGKPSQSTFVGPSIMNYCIAYLHIQATEAIHTPDHGITAHQSRTQVGIPAHCQTFWVFLQLHINFLISGLNSRLVSDALIDTNFEKMGRQVWVSTDSSRLY